MVALPRRRARTRPVSESAVAVSVSLDRHWNTIEVGSPGHGGRLALARTVSPTCRVAVDCVMPAVDITHPTEGASEPPVSRLQPKVASMRPATRTTFVSVKGIELPNALS